jgi:hypothetical protein
MKISIWVIGPERVGHRVFLDVAYLYGDDEKRRASALRSCTISMITNIRMTTSSTTTDVAAISGRGPTGFIHQEQRGLINGTAGERHTLLLASDSSRGKRLPKSDNPTMANVASTLWTRAR